MRRPLVLLLVSSATRADAWTEMTLYDVLPEDCRTSIAEKDVGDPGGDAFFNVRPLSSVDVVTVETEIMVLRATPRCSALHTRSGQRQVLAGRVCRVRGQPKGVPA
jgi:hypothetical protein